MENNGRMYDVLDIHEFSPIIKNQSQISRSRINHSGNSDVDVSVNVEVDVIPIAVAMLYTLLASKQISNREFESAIQRLQSLSQRNSVERNRRYMNNSFI